MATKRRDAERKRNLSKDKMMDDFGGWLFTAAERKEIDALGKKAKAKGAAEAKKAKKK